MTNSVTYVDYDITKPIRAAWLNDVDRLTYTALGSGGVAPASAAAVIANLGLLTTALAATTYLTQANAAATYAPVAGTMNIGTTAVTLNRASSALVLTGITSIDGNAASATNATNLLNTATTKLPTITATVAASALTIGMSSVYLDFRSATIGSGAITTLLAAPAALVVPSTATLGTVSAVQSRLVVLAINNAGAVEIAVVNIAGGNDLSETGVISTTAIAAGSNTANVIYSTSARANVAYRVVGYVESTQATAGTWATALSTIQGAGGNALTAMSSFGYGQTWQTVTRTAGTTYYNTTGKPISIKITSTGSGTACQVALTVGNYAFSPSYSSAGNAPLMEFSVIQPNQSYSYTLSSGTVVISELR
jgi:hypothetical protein